MTSGHDYTFVMRHENPDQAHLSFVQILEDKATYDFRQDEVILEDHNGPGRARYTIWQRREHGVWYLHDSEPGILELLADDMYDEPCAGCVTELDVGDDWDHADDCPLDEDGNLPDDLCDEFRYFCCDGHRDAVEDAHRHYKADHEDATCSLYPEFVMLDGGDVLCRHHVVEWFGAPFVTLLAPGVSEADDLQRTYFAGREDLGDDMPDIPDPRVLADLAHLVNYRRLLEQADRARQRRDDTIAQLRGAISQTTIADYSGVSQQRIGQIQRDAEETLRELRERLSAAQ